MQIQVVELVEQVGPGDQPAPPVGEWAGLGDASQRLGIPLDTLRRKAKRGDVTARRVPTPQGHRWEVWLADDQAPTEPASSRLADPPASQELAGLVAVLDRVTHENRELAGQNLQLAGRVGWLEAELQAARARIAMLEAPPRTAPSSHADTCAMASTRLPWWRRWWPWQQHST